MNIRRSNRGSSIMADREYLRNIMNSRYLDRRQKIKMLQMIAMRRGRQPNFKRQQQHQLLKKKKRQTRKFDQVTIGEHTCPMNVANRIGSLQKEINNAEQENDFAEVEILEEKVDILLENACTKYL